MTAREMHALNVTDVTHIATETARAHSPDLKVVGVTLGGEDGDYAEVIIDVVGCHIEPCRLSIGVFRNADASHVRNEIATHLQRHLQDHRAQR